MSRAALLLFGIVFLARSAAGATFTVTATHDAPDATPGNGVCATAAGPCTLRAAIQEANATAVADSIVLPAGTFAIGIAGADEDAAATGDLDVTAPLTLTGAGATSIIDGAGLDRIFDVHAGAALFDASSMTLRNGRALTATGGAIRVNGNGGVVLAIESVAFANNRAADGGALAMTRSPSSSDPDVWMTHATFEGNQATNHGGALYAESVPMRIEWSRFENNSAGGDGGALHVTGYNAEVSIAQSLIAGNIAHDGGGLYTCCETSAPVGTSMRVTIANSTVSTNRATGSGGAAFFASSGSFYNSTVANNVAAATGGLHIGLSARAFFSVLANANGNCNSGSLAAGLYTVVSDDTCGVGTPENPVLHGVDPQLGPLADNGGPTRTHALLAGSPAIDFIPLARAFNPIDQRGTVRPFGPGNDAGAFEVSTASPVATIDRRALVAMVALLALTALAVLKR